MPVVVYNSQANPNRYLILASLHARDRWVMYLYIKDIDKLIKGQCLNLKSIRINDLYFDGKYVKYNYIECSGEWNQVNAISIAPNFTAVYAEDDDGKKIKLCNVGCRTVQDISVFPPDFLHNIEQNISRFGKYDIVKIDDKEFNFSQETFSLQKPIKDVEKLVYKPKRAKGVIVQL